METLVFGRIAGQEMAQYAKGAGKKAQQIDSIHREHAQQRLEHVQSNSTETRPYHVRQKLQEMMMRDCGIFRSHATLTQGLQAWKKIHSKSMHLRVEDKSEYFNTDLIEALETQNLIAFSQAILSSALARTESRGSHTRLDYTKRDDAHWLKHTLARKGASGVQLDYKPVVIKNYKPEARHY